MLQRYPLCMKSCIACNYLVNAYNVLRKYELLRQQLLRCNDNHNVAWGRFTALSSLWCKYTTQTQRVELVACLLLLNLSRVVLRSYINCSSKYILQSNALHP